MQTRPLQVPRQQKTATPSPARGAAANAGEGVAPRLARFGSVDVTGALVEECLLRVDVNGCPAGVLRAIPDAPRELAAGWTFINGFFDLSDTINHITVCNDRVSIMVDGGTDLDRRRLAAAGWIDPQEWSLCESPAGERSFEMAEHRLLALVERAFQQFGADGARE